MNRDNRLWLRQNASVPATLCICEKCGEGMEVALEHVCRKKNSYPVEDVEGVK